jgi:hypothetical protein
MNESEMNVRSGQVIDAAMRVHSKLGEGDLSLHGESPLAQLGPGLLEGAYEACLAHAAFYDGERVEIGYRVDLLVGNALIVEVKAIAKVCRDPSAPDPAE